MKTRILMVLVLVIGITRGIFAQELVPVANWNAAFINSFAPNNQSVFSFFADSSEKDGIMAHYNRVPAAFLNFLPGFGIGSFVQGDMFGFGVGLAGELTGLVFLLIGAFTPPEEVRTNAGGGYYYISYEPRGEGPMYFGLVTLLATKLFFGLVRPFYYANKFIVDVSPGLNSNGQMALTGSVRFRF